MPVANIVDARTNNKNVMVDAVFEPTHHDNECKGATKFKGINLQSLNELCWELCKTTVGEAIFEANQRDFPVTIYLYDYGSYVMSREKING